MTTAVAITTILIVLARIVDMSLDTVRTASIVQHRRLFAASLGFVQALIYICAIAKVLQDMSHPTYAVAYALALPWARTSGSSSSSVWRSGISSRRCTRAGASN